MLTAPVQKKSFCLLHFLNFVQPPGRCVASEQNSTNTHIFIPTSNVFLFGIFLQGEQTTLGVVEFSKLLLSFYPLIFTKPGSEVLSPCQTGQYFPFSRPPLTQCQKRPT